MLLPGPTRPRGRLSAGATSLSVRLSRVGLENLELSAESVGLRSLDGQEADLELDDLFDVVRGRVSARDEASGTFAPLDASVAVTRRIFGLVPAMEGAGPSLAPSVTERIDDPGRILLITRALVANRTLGRIRAAGRDWVLRPERLAGGVISWAVLSHGGTPTSPLLVECSGYGALYSLSLLLAGGWGSPLLTTVPLSVQRSRQRRMPRTAAPDELTVRFAHPKFGFVVDRRLGDLSEEGLGMLSVGSEDLLCPGLDLPKVVVVRDGVEVVELRATVRSVSANRDRVGLAVAPIDDDDAPEWRRLVRELLHERTRSDGYTAAALWTLYEASGYFSLSGRKPEDFAPLRSAFEHATEQLLRAPDIGYHVVWPGAHELYASVANVLVYSRAHLGFQMAKLPGRALGGASGKAILRDIHWHTLEEALASSHSDYWIGYVQPETRFSNLLYCEFQSRFRDPEHECVVPIHPFQVPCGRGERADEVEARGDIGRPTGAELFALSEHIRATRPRPYWESQDLTLEQLDLHTVRHRWARAGLERDRLILIARSADGQPEAALIAELAQPGLHVYGLMDIARIIALAPDGERRASELLDAAGAWYAERDRSSFVYFHEGDGPPPDREDLHSMGRASLCVISMNLIPDLLDHLFEHMAWDPVDSMPPPRS